MQAQLDADPKTAGQNLESWKAYKKGFQEGIALFNQKPKKGIAFLQVSFNACAGKKPYLQRTRDANLCMKEGMVRGILS